MEPVASYALHPVCVTYDHARNHWMALRRAPRGESREWMTLDHCAHPRESVD